MIQTFDLKTKNKKSFSGTLHLSREFKEQHTSEVKKWEGQSTVNSNVKMLVNNKKKILQMSCFSITSNFPPPKILKVGIIFVF